MYLHVHVQEAGVYLGQRALRILEAPWAGHEGAVLATTPDARAHLGPAEYAKRRVRQQRDRRLGQGFPSSARP